MYRFNVQKTRRVSRQLFTIDFCCWLFVICYLFGYIVMLYVMFLRFFSCCHEKNRQWAKNALDIVSVTVIYPLSLLVGSFPTSKPLLFDHGSQ